MTIGADLPPFFVVGAQRSGSTLLRLMLDHHPEIAVPHEFDFAVERVSEDGTTPPMDEYRAWLGHHGSFRRSRLRVDPALDYPSLMESFLRQRQGDKRLVGMVVHRSFHRLLHFWPQARFVHLVRDPRDVARSVVGRGWAGSVWSGAVRWVEAERSWDVLREAIPTDRWIDVRYEELAADPEPALARICTFLGVAYDPAVLRYDRDTTYGAPDPAHVASWRTSLTSFEQRLVEARVGALLTARGYEPSGHPPLRVGPLRRAWLEFYGRGARLRFRAARFGLGWMLLHGVTRRTGPPALAARVRRRVEAIADRRVR